MTQNAEMKLNTDKHPKYASNDDATKKQCHPGIIVEGLTSEVFSVENPPQDWADVAFLVPHEPIRHELAALERNLEALTMKVSNGGIDANESWRVLYFSEWIVDTFIRMIHTHHTNEEEIYFPWVAKKAAEDMLIAEEKKSRYTADHDTIAKSILQMESLCETMIQKRGLDCVKEIQKLQAAMPQFSVDLLGHLRAEEEHIPAVLRAHFTPEEEQKVILTMGKKDGLNDGIKTFLCSILVSMKAWATPEFKQDFLSDIPGPLCSLVSNYFLPDFENVTMAKRDSPTLSEKPALTRQRCCKLSFCGPCIL